ALFTAARALPFLVDALSYAFSLASLIAIRAPFQEEREPVQGEPLRSQIAEGIHWLWRQRFLRTCAVLATWATLTFEALLLVLIVEGHRQGLSGGEIGLLLAALGGFLVIGSLLSPRIQRRVSMRMLIVGWLWINVCVGFFVIDPSVYVLLAAALPSVFMTPTVNA